MAKKTFYTERDIEDLASRGVSSLEIGPDVYLTDLARDRAGRLGVALVREHDSPSSAPVRPYIAKPSPAGDQPAASAAKPAAGDAELHAKVRAAVIHRLGKEVDPGLLDTIIRRVLQNIGRAG